MIDAGTAGLAIGIIAGTFFGKFVAQTFWQAWFMHRGYDEATAEVMSRRVVD